VLVVCDTDHTTIFQASGVTGTTSVFHNTGVGTPGNCTTNLAFPLVCGSGGFYQFPRNSQIGRLVAVDWYIGNNDRAAEGGRSLYRRRLGLGGTVLTEEIVAGITDMQLQFRATGSNDIIPDATTVADWTAISTVLVEITAESSDINLTNDAPGANTGRIARSFNYLISLRNRLP
jgi:type IV pilus assembly protein PilW